MPREPALSKNKTLRPAQPTQQSVSLVIIRHGPFLHDCPNPYCPPFVFWFYPYIILLLLLYVYKFRHLKPSRSVCVNPPIAVYRVRIKHYEFHAWRNNSGAMIIWLVYGQVKMINLQLWRKEISAHRSYRLRQIDYIVLVIYNLIVRK